MAATEQPYQVDTSNKYPFVASTQEHQRLDEQSRSLNELMHGQISFAPLQQPAKILDIGCGTGIQTRLLAQKYPEAVVIGVDPNPVPAAETEPKNVVFILGRIEDLVGKHDLLQFHTFDLVYQRMLLMSIYDWKAHAELNEKLLKPGGWLESQEGAFFEVYDKDEHLISENWQFFELLKRNLAPRGVNLAIGRELPGICKELRFTDVQSEKFPSVYRPGWEAAPEAERLGRYHEWATPHFFHSVIRSFAKPDEGDDAEALVRESDETMFNGTIGYHSFYHVTVARKPEN